MINFSKFGLNKFRNLIGDDIEIKIESQSDMIDCACGLLDKNESENCGIFIIDGDNNMWAFLKTPNENNEPFLCFKYESYDVNYFARIDAELRLECYGIIVSDIMNNWYVIKE